VTDKQ